MVSETVIFKNLTGLHLRPAGILCTEASNFQCHIEFEHNGVRWNAKSILQVLSAGVRYGEAVRFVCDGEDEEAALKRVIEVVEEMLNE